MSFPKVKVSVSANGFSVAINGESHAFECINQGVLNDEYKTYVNSELKRYQTDAGAFEKCFAISSKDRQSIKAFSFFVTWEHPELDLHMNNVEIKDLNSRLRQFVTFAGKAFFRDEPKLIEYFDRGISVAIEELLLALKEFKSVKRPPDVTAAFWKTIFQVLPWLERLGRVKHEIARNQNLSTFTERYDELFNEIKDEFDKRVQECIRVIDLTDDLPPSPQSATGQYATTLLTSDAVSQQRYSESGRYERENSAVDLTRTLPTLRQSPERSSYYQDTAEPCSVNGDRQPLLREWRGTDSYFSYGSGQTERRDDEEERQDQGDKTVVQCKIETVRNILKEANNAKWDTYHTISGTFFNIFCSCVKSPPTAIVQLRALDWDINASNVNNLISEIREIMQEARGRYSPTRWSETQRFYDKIERKLEKVVPQCYDSYQV